MIKYNSAKIKALTQNREKSYVVITENDSAEDGYYTLMDCGRNVDLSESSWFWHWNYNTDFSILQICHFTCQNSHGKIHLSKIHLSNIHLQNSACRNSSLIFTEPNNKLPVTGCSQLLLGSRDHRSLIRLAKSRSIQFNADWVMKTTTSTGEFLQVKFLTGVFRQVKFCCQI